MRHESENTKTLMLKFAYFIAENGMFVGIECAHIIFMNMLRRRQNLKFAYFTAENGMFVDIEDAHIIFMNMLRRCHNLKFADVY